MRRRINRKSVQVKDWSLALNATHTPLKSDAVDDTKLPTVGLFIVGAMFMIVSLFASLNFA